MSGSGARRPTARAPGEQALFDQVQRVGEWGLLSLGDGPQPLEELVNLQGNRLGSSAGGWGGRRLLITSSPRPSRSCQKSGGVCVPYHS